jgi:hypothetical protein
MQTPIVRFNLQTFDKPSSKPATSEITGGRVKKNAFYMRKTAGKRKTSASHGDEYEGDSFVGHCAA